LKNDASACKVIRYRMAHLIWFALSNAASVGVGISALVSRGICHFYHNRVPEYLFSISDTSETISCMETTPPNMNMVYVPSASVTSSQCVLSV
jgi:hypothetical protein